MKSRPALAIAAWCVCAAGCAPASTNAWHARHRSERPHRFADPIGPGVTTSPVIAGDLVLFGNIDGVLRAVKY